MLPLKGVSDALTRLNTGINGDDTTASSPIVPTDFLINSRLVKPLSLFCTQDTLFRLDLQP